MDTTTPDNAPAAGAFDAADPFAQAMAEATPELGISAAAAERLAYLLRQEDDPDTMLRVTVSGGGCSGYQYKFDFDRQAGPDDRVFERDGVRVVTDSASLGLLAGAQVDYIDDLIGAYFTVNNPNASSSCGCGTSFAI